MKTCIACAEDIKEEAKLCKHCGTRQDDSEFLGQPKKEDCKSPNKDSELAVKLTDSYKSAWEDFGPFGIVGQEELEGVDPELIWTQVWGPDYTAMVSGFVESSEATGWYFIANRKVSPEINLRVVDCSYFTCGTCLGDFDNCIDCQESGHACIDYQEIVLRSGVSTDKEEEIWSQRVPGGTIHIIQLPEDFERFPNLPKPSWISNN